MIGLALMSVTVAAIVGYMAANKPADLGGILVLYIGVGLLAVLYTRRYYRSG